MSRSIRTLLSAGLFWVAQASPAAAVDMKEGHPLGWGLVVLCVVLGLMVSLTPVRRERKVKGAVEKPAEKKKAGE